MHEQGNVRHGSVIILFLVYSNLKYCLSGNCDTATKQRAVTEYAKNFSRIDFSKLTVVIQQCEHILMYQSSHMQGVIPSVI